MDGNAKSGFCFGLLDIVSIRGFGRLQIRAIEGTTKKEKFVYHWVCYVNKYYEVIAMALTPLDIQNKVFSNKMRGFDRDEVLDFLDLVARDYEIACAKKS